MPRLKAFDKKTATTYRLLNRAQDDPLIHDSDAPSQVFTEIGSSRQPSVSKAKQRGDLEEEFGLAFRQNEGQAAEQGVFYDDSKYDYMQHMRELGTGSGEATWVEAKSAQKGKGKERQSLEDALSEMSFGDEAGSVSGTSISGSMASSSKPVRSVFEQQQDVPDDLAGFQPDMDPRLREVLEALDDDAYVDDEDDIFGELAGEGGEEVDRDTFEDSLFDLDDEGWESDETEKPTKEYQTAAATDFIPLSHPIDTPTETSAGLQQPDDPSIPAPSAESQDLLASLVASERGTDNKPTLQQPKAPKLSDLTSSAQLSTSSSALTGRKKKRKGALTNGSSFSMTSSALARTEPLSILDSRFDKIAESYLEDSYDGEGEDDVASLASGMTGASRMSKASGFSRASRGSAWGGSQASQTSEAPSLVDSDQFNSVMDEFLGGVDGKEKKRLMRKGGTQGQYVEGQGMQHLDELRSRLGPARLSARYGSAQRT